MAISCCRGCVPPKRNPYCHGNCPEYVKEKAAYEARKAEVDKENFVRCGVLSQRLESSYRAMKRCRKKG